MMCQSLCTSEEGIRVVTVRMPPSLHEKLKAASHDHIVRGRASMNGLCVQILMDWIAAREKAAAEKAAPQQSEPHTHGDAQ